MARRTGRTGLTSPGLPALPEVKLLRLFDLLYSTRSVTRAAEQLGQGQPTVSIWLGRLRTILNDPLFVRTPDGMQPTPRADDLIGVAREALEALNRMSSTRARFTPETATRRFRICMTDASHVNLLPHLLVAMRDRAPLVQLEIARIGGETGDRLQAGDADIAIGLVPELDAGFFQQTLFGQDWVCLANNRHPRLGQGLTLEAYQNEPHVSVKSGTGHLLLQAALDSQRIQRRLMLELPGFLGLAAIVGTTDLIATVPRQTGETLAASAGLRLLACPFRIEAFDVKQYWHARYHHDPANRWLRGVCEALFQKRGSGPGAGVRTQRGKKAPFKPGTWTDGSRDTDRPAATAGKSERRAPARHRRT